MENPHKKTILQIIPHTTYSGVETSAKQIAANLSNGYRVVVLSESKELESYFANLGIKHFYLNIHSTNPFIILQNALKIVSIIRKENIDIVHARSRAPAWSCAIAAKLTNRFFITTFHAIYNNSSILKRYYNSIMAKGKRIVAISMFVKKYVIENYSVHPSRVIHIRRGIDTDYFKKENVSDEVKEKFKEKYHLPDTITIVVPADFSKWKGHSTMLEALSIIKDLKFYCLFVGDLVKHPDYTHFIRNKIMALKLQSKVRVFGFEPDKRSLYSITDIIASISTAPEALDKTIIEAQSMEKIVVATNLGSSPEMIEDGINGFLVTPKDSKDLSDKLRFIIENFKSDQIEKIKENAKKSAIESFNLTSMIQETAKLYDDIFSEYKK